MDFLKRQLFFIICGVVAVLGIVLGVLGLRGMPAVMAEMQGAESLYRNLTSLRSDPVSKEHITFEEQRIESIVNDLDRISAKARELGKYEQLVDGMFPRCDLEQENRFREQYVIKIEELLNSLNNGRPAREARPATEYDIDFMRDEIAKEERKMNMDRYLADDASALPVDEEGPYFTPGMVLTKSGALKDPVARAHMSVAQSLLCYVNLPEERIKKGVEGEIAPAIEPVDEVPLSGQLGDRPSTAVLWHAQVSLWLQTDVVEAINRVNRKAAAEYEESIRDQPRAQPAWVGVMPVKDVISIRVSDYVVDPESTYSNYGMPEGDFEALPLGSGEVFTGSICNDMYDVVQFTVKVVMDQRDIPLLIQEICRDRFHTPLRVSYKVVPPNHRMYGKIYGSEPVVSVVLDFETIMLGEIYRPMMPVAVLEELGYEVPTEGE